MSGSYEFNQRILLVDDEPKVLSEFKKILCPSVKKSGSELKDLEAKLFGKSSGNRTVTSYDLVLCNQGDEAVEQVRKALEENRPFSVAFLDVRMPPGPDGIWTAEHIRELDPFIQLVMMTGYSDIDPVEISRIVPPEDKLLYIQKPVHAQELRQFALALSAKWHSEIQLQKQAVELESANAHLTCEIEEHKLTEEKLIEVNEKLKEHDRLKSEFVMTVSHELRTPLTIFKNIISNALAGVTGKIPPKLRRNLEIADGTVGRLASIISDFLDISKIEVGKMKLACRPMSIQTIVTDVVDTLRFMTESREIDLQINLPEDEILINADYEKMVQVLTNLIDNAVKYVPEDEGHIKVTVKDINGEVRVNVEDNGVGIEGEDINRVFNRFVQVEKQIGPGKHGTGLGLAICKELVELHKGRIWVENLPTSGAKFCIMLPKYDGEITPHSEDAEKTADSVSASL
jgi:signal transduction histidine kinase